MVWDPDPPADPLAIYDQSYYNGDFPKGGYTNYIQGMQVNQWTFRRRLLAAERKLGGQKGSLLDVGCALGDCLLQARELGWAHPQGLEVSPYAVETGRQRGLEIHLGDLLQNDLTPGSFDLILLQDVIEHTADPCAMLEAARRYLRPGGFLLLTTPNVGGWLARCLGGAWYHYKQGEHLTYFSRATICRALKNCGFLEIDSGMTTNTMSVEYLFDRMMTYQSPLFSALSRVVRRVGLGVAAINLPIGELQAWARHP